MAQLRSSLDQWQVLAAVVDAGGFAQAAARLHRSQSAISYTMAQLQERTGRAAARDAGPHAPCSPPRANELLRRSRAGRRPVPPARGAGPRHRLWLESELQAGGRCGVSAGRACSECSPNCGAAVRTPRCRWPMPCSPVRKKPSPRAHADVVVTTRVPTGFLGDWLMDVEMVAVAAPSHPLHAAGTRAHAR